MASGINLADVKLSAQYTRASMLVTVIVLLIAGGVYYAAISYIADRQFDRDLTEEFGEMNEFTQQHQRFPKPFEFDSYNAEFKPVGKFFASPRFTDTLVKVPGQARVISGRAIIAIVSLKDTNYLMTIIESKEATDNLVQLIFGITILLTVFLLLALFFTNRVLLNGLWQPFYHLLTRLQSFSLTGQSVHENREIKIDEFRELQTAINTMAAKAGAEYQSLKTFTENASHEMMTPIAVITSKLDNLIQDEALTGTQLDQLQDIYNASSKLSRLNQSLLLLVKIDNQLINDVVELDISQHVDDKIKQFSEIAAQKSINVSATLQAQKVLASPYLIDVLLNNLISNAIRHNTEHGQIRIAIHPTCLVIANTGSPAPLDTGKIFERFQKSPASEGTGLGLTIARNICNGYGWELTYAFEADYHTFTISFPAI